jgi:hypothetical protein
MTDDFVPGGGSALVLEWLTRIVEAAPPAQLIWKSLDDPLRLAMVQSWLLASGAEPIDESSRDEIAAQLAARDRSHPAFDDFYAALVAHYQKVYGHINGRPCLAGLTEAIGVDMELVAVSSEEFVGSHDGEVGVPAHSFITRHLGDDRWVIAANARRLPVPGWPPTEQVLPGLQIDGN